MTILDYLDRSPLALLQNEATHDEARGLVLEMSLDLNKARAWRALYEGLEKDLRELDPETDHVSKWIRHPEPLSIDRFFVAVRRGASALEIDELARLLCSPRQLVSLAEAIAEQARLDDEALEEEIREEEKVRIVDFLYKNHPKRMVGASIYEAYYFLREGATVTDLGELRDSCKVRLEKLLAAGHFRTTIDLPPGKRADCGFLFLIPREIEGTDSNALRDRVERNALDEFVMIELESKDGSRWSHERSIPPSEGQTPFPGIFLFVFERS
jgi:hypothetical protein